MFATYIFVLRHLGLLLLVQYNSQIFSANTMTLLL